MMLLEMQGEIKRTEVWEQVNSPKLAAAGPLYI
jgi:hypothetical protein